MVCDEKSTVDLIIGLYLVLACSWAFMIFFIIKMLDYDAFGCITLRLGFVELLGYSAKIFHPF